MKKIILYVIVSTNLFLSACSKDASLETIDDLAVVAYLHSGKILDTLKLKKVLPLDAETAETLPGNLAPIISNKAGTIFPLVPTGGAGEYLHPDFIVEEGETYSLELEYKGEIISAETFIPSAPANMEVSDSVVFRKKINDFTDLIDQIMPDPIEVKWEGEDGAFYFVNIKNIEDDPVLINELFGEGDTSGFPDVQTEPSTSTTFAINTFRDLTHYGKYEVTVFRVNPEYVVLYEDNSSGAGALNQISTNVKNGFGIFTGINSKTAFFEVKQQ